MFTTAAYMYLPSLSGDLRISNMTTVTAKTVSNTTTPAMIHSTSLEIALLHFIIEFRFIKIVIQCTFSCLYSVYREDSEIKAQSCRYTRQKCNLSVSLKCRFSEFRRGNPPIIMRKLVIGHHLKYSALPKAKFRRIILGKHVT